MATLASCSSLGYTLQAAAGGAAILLKRRPIERVLARPDLAPEMRRQLEAVAGIREFAERELALPAGGAYRSYVELGREFVTWNVVAAPALSVEPVTWCFPVAGCVSYRGYFREARARRFARRLVDRGFDVTVQGVTAFSSLGWFEDPVLDTFLDGGEWRLAGLVFHELAHRRLYVAGDTAFNESFASVVEELGLERWLAARGNPAEIDAAHRARTEERLLNALLLGARNEAAALYGSTRSAPEKLAAKAALFARLRSAQRQLRATNQISARFDGWLDRPLSNADLAATADYALWVPALRQLWLQTGSFERFHAECQRAGEMEPADRLSYLVSLERASAPLRDR